MRKLLPLVLALIGLGGGLGLGLALRPGPEAELAANPCGTTPTDAQGGSGTEGEGHATAPGEGGAHAEGEEGVATREYVKLNNQFIVPVVQKGTVQSLVILSISLEVALGESEKVFQLEPKLRDSFLQVMFDHANSGGFDGAYTNSNTMEVLRTALFETARGILGKTVSDVLIIDIVRQDN